MAINISSSSYLRFSELVSVDGVEFWDLLEIPDIPEQPGDLTHTVTGVDRIDLLAEQYYQDPNLKFVIAVANDLEIFPTELNPGDVLRIPSPRWVLTEFFKKAK